MVSAAIPPASRTDDLQARERQHTRTDKVEVIQTWFNSESGLDSSRSSLSFIDMWALEQEVTCEATNRFILGTIKEC
jgi:hypothetical protein